MIKRIEADCPKCINDLHAFSEEISALLDTSKVNLVYIIHTNNYTQFKDLVLPGITGIQPLVIDTVNKFIIDNDIPMFDQRFHTLLIDSLQRIVLIGDPSDDRIATLYMKYIDF